MKAFAKSSKVATSQHAKFLIVGAGDAGVSVAKLIRENKLVKSTDEIKLIDTKKTYWYQSGQTKVGAGINTLKEIQIANHVRFPQRQIVIDSRVDQVFPEDNYVKLVDGSLVGYENLIIATGTNPTPEKTPGLKEAFEDETIPVASVYLPHLAVKYANLRKQFQGGVALYCLPKTPIKCQGASQKVMYTSAEEWQKQGKKVEILFHSGGDKMLSPDYYHVELYKIAKSYGIDVTFKSELLEVRGKDRVAIFEQADGKKKDVKFDLMHVAPIHVPSEFIAKSGLASPNGYAEVDIYSLQHKKFKNVWALGDAADLPTSKTLSAVNTQVHIVANNLKAISKGLPLVNYSGYTACPVMTDKKKVLMCEFGYEHKLMPTFHQKPRPSRLTGFIYRKIFRLTSLYGFNYLIRPLQAIVRKFFQIFRL